MAQLLRYTGLGPDAATLTFLLPPSLGASEGPPEILSRDFLFAGLAWRLCLSKRDGTHISPYLQLQSTGLSATVDYSFALLNRESFTQNEKFAEKAREFSDEAGRKHGKRTFVSLADLERRKGFATPKREFLMELTMQRPRIRLHSLLQLSPAPASDHRRQDDTRQLDYRQYDSHRFNFGEQEWQLSFCPNMDAGDGRLHHLFQLQRIGRTEHLCRIRYRLLLGHPPESRQWSSGRQEELVEYSGNARGLYLGTDYLAYATPDAQLPVTLELFSVAAISQLRVSLSADGGRVHGSSVAVQDRDKQGWTLTAACSGADYLTFSLNYTDIPNVPAGYVRFVSAAFRLLPSARAPDDVQPLQPPDSPLENYFAFTGHHDRGSRVRFPVLLSDVLRPGSPWMDADGDTRVTMQVDWLVAHLLLGPTYSLHDDVIRKHVHQMRREVAALQVENEALEKEMHRYQVSISHKCAAGPPNGRLESSYPGPAPSSAERSNNLKYS